MLALCCDLWGRGVSACQGVSSKDANGSLVQEQGTGLLYKQAYRRLLVCSPNVKSRVWGRNPSRTIHAQPHRCRACRAACTARGLEVVWRSDLAFRPAIQTAAHITLPQRLPQPV